MSLCQAARGEEWVGRLGAVHAAVSVAPSRQFLYTPFPVFIASATHGEAKCGESAICFKLRHHGLGLVEGHSVVIHPHPPPLIRRAVDSDNTHPRNNEIQECAKATKTPDGDGHSPQERRGPLSFGLLEIGRYPEYCTGWRAFGSRSWRGAAGAVGRSGGKEGGRPVLRYATRSI